MKASFFAVGFADGEDGCEIEDIVNFIELELPRIPCKGERFGLWINDVWIGARVAEVWTNYRQPGNPHIKESSWGFDFLIYLDECEIRDRYKRR